MIKKQLRLASVAIVKENCNSIEIENTPFNLVKIEEDKYAVTIGNTIVVEGNLHNLCDKFNENIFNILMWFVEQMIEFKLNNKEVKYEQ